MKNHGDIINYSNKMYFVLEENNKSKNGICDGCHFNNRKCTISKEEKDIFGKCFDEKTGKSIVFILAEPV